MKNPRKTATAPQTIEHNAEEPMRTETGEALSQAAPSDSGEVAMPGVENEPPYTFMPKQGCSILDTFEVALMYLIHLTNSQVQFEPGTLRHVHLPAARFSQLSGRAQQQMQAVALQETAPAE